ncbi:hypothetical protein AADY36_08470 [Pseudoalteromonas sp. D15MCD-2]|uniref:hypothetical protein n=1 Tax=Pseudoalteromonas sp. D15MCD-2 TaxID=3138933 RepID=UPI0031591A3E
MNFTAAYRIFTALFMLILTIGLGITLNDFISLIYVFVPLLLMLGASFIPFFKARKLRLVLFAAPIVIFYCFGFYPWLTNYQEVSVSSSTSTLDFIIIPAWATLYGAGFVVLHEIALGVARAFDWGK